MDTNDGDSLEVNIDYHINQFTFIKTVGTGDDYDRENNIGNNNGSRNVCPGLFVSSQIFFKIFRNENPVHR